MKIQNFISPLRFLAAIFGVSLVASLPQPGLAEVNSHSAATLGLTLAWETNVGGGPLAHGEHSFVIWPHSTAKRESVTVKYGNKVVMQIRGDEIDQEAVDLAIAKGESIEKLPRIGMEGAMKRAEKLAATYETLGKKVVIKPSPSSQLTYIVTLSERGILTTIDADTGEVIWAVEAGDPRLPFYGPGVSDDHVVITNGNYLTIFSLEDGTKLNTRKLQFTATGSPSAMPGKALVPSDGGRLVGYDVKDLKEAPIVLRSGDENRVAIQTSVNRRFVCWPMKSKLILADIENNARLWTSIAAGETVVALPVAVETGYIACGINGTVIHFSTDRVDSIRWKRRLAAQVTKSPVASKDAVFIVSDEEKLFCMSITDGSNLWANPVRNIHDIVSVGKDHVYAVSGSNQLVSIDKATGTEVKVSSIQAPKVLPNSVSDRLYFVDSKGELTCLRETDAESPVYIANFKANNDDASSKKKENLSDEPTESTDAAPVEDSLFEGAGDATDDLMGDDPFAADPME
jgi:outer membrane protein assembly factor BamB